MRLKQFYGYMRLKFYAKNQKSSEIQFFIKLEQKKIFKNLFGSI